MRWKATVAVPCAGAAVIFALPDSQLSELAYYVCFASIVVTAWLAYRGGRALPWLLIAAAQTCWLVGDLVGYTLDLFGWGGDVGPPDCFWLGGYPLLGGALIVMVRLRAPKQSTRAAALDCLALATAAAMWLWQLMVAPAVADSEISTMLVVNALYPLGDVVLLGAMLYLVLSPGQRRAATRLLVAGMGLTFAGDTAMTLLGVYADGYGTARLDGLLLVANGLIVAAARHPGRDELITPVHVDVTSLHPARAIMLGLGLVTPPMIAIVRGALSTPERVSLAVGSVITVAVSLARVVGAVRQQGRAQRLLAHQAAYDELTGLANRRTLIDRLENGYRREADTVLLYADLDGFKAINDTYGHAAGDAVLVEVAGRLRRTVRTLDLVARLGGDEFAILCHRLPPGEARNLADRIAATIEEPIEHHEHTFAVSVSIGLSAAADCASGDELIATADRAMYAAKHARRTAVPLAPVAQSGA